MSVVYSIVIPVYRSEQIIAKTIQRIMDVSENEGFAIELVLVNDGSPDNSWSILEQAAKRDQRIKSINLLKNYGQHTAVYCGIKESTGDFIITMDDDLQNPPEELHHLISKINEGYDLVFAEFNQKMHAGFRKLGTRIVGYLNNKIFGKPKDLKLTNFRIFTRATANRLIAYRTNYPYIPGLLLMSASKMANVQTEHHSREIGNSNYTLVRILTLVARLLFNYSSYPLKIVSGAGIIISLLSFLAGVFFIIKSMVLGVEVQGWTTIVALVSFLCGFILIMLGIMGEYLSRIMNQLASSEPYQIREIIG
jgi:glycosyltransferase involved in cell wall biosynthesis